MRRAGVALVAVALGCGGTVDAGPCAGLEGDLAAFCAARATVAAPPEEASGLVGRCRALPDAARDFCLDGVARRRDVPITAADCAVVGATRFRESCHLWLAERAFRTEDDVRLGARACAAAGSLQNHCLSHLAFSRGDRWAAQGLAAAIADVDGVLAEIPTAASLPNVGGTVGEYAYRALGPADAPAVCARFPPGAAADTCRHDLFLRATPSGDTPPGGLPGVPLRTPGPGGADGPPPAR